MTHILLIHAGPTPWDVEDRLVGNHPLPLTDLARATIQSVVQNRKTPIMAIYRHRKNEAVEQAAKILSAETGIRPRDAAALDEVNLGLWQGLTRADLRFRFPSVFPQWEDNPLTVNPPEGESLPDAIQRLQGGLKGIIRRNRGAVIALPMRPMAMQVTLGLLRGETPEQIAGHLHNTSAVETMTLTHDLPPGLG